MLTLQLVEKDCYVKYSIDQEINFIKIDDKTDLSRKLLGHKKGDIVSIKRPLLSTLDSILIVRIMDKYLYLHDQILEEVKNNPYSGFPMQSVEFPDMSPEGLKKSLISMLGPSGSIKQEQQTSIWNDYYNYQTSFSEIVLQLYSSDYIGGYFNLINYKEGFTQVSLLYYPKRVFKSDDEIIIDFTSIFLLFQIFSEHNIKYQQKFLVAKSTVEFVRQYLKKERLNKQKQMTLNVTLESVHVSLITEKDNESNIKFLERLLLWIESNCIITITESKLDILNSTNEEIRNDAFSNISLDNISLVTEESNRIIMTDDSFYFKFFPINSGKNISVELYIKSYFENNTEILQEFIKYRYIGFTITHDLLLNEFKKKLKDQPNYFSHCHSNTSLRLIPSNGTIMTIVKFLKEIALNSFLTDEIYSQVATNAFVNLLKGQKNIRVIQTSRQIIVAEFKLLGSKLDLIIESFENALRILNHDK